MLTAQRSLHPVLSGCLCTVRGTHFARSVAGLREEVLDVTSSSGKVITRLQREKL